MALEDGYHVTLLALDSTGYSNLCHAITAAQLAGPKGLAPLSREVLARYSAGLLCLSGCREGELPRLIRGDMREKARRAAHRYIELFGRDRFFIELQNTLYPDDAALSDALVELARECGIGYVATNNVHYARKEAHRLHDVLTCIRDRSTLDDCPELKLTAEFYLKSHEEMLRLFSAHAGGRDLAKLPDAGVPSENTRALRRCDGRGGVTRCT